YSLPPRRRFRRTETPAPRSCRVRSFLSPKCPALGKELVDDALARFLVLRGFGLGSPKIRFIGDDMKDAFFHIGDEGVAGFDTHLLPHRRRYDDPPTVPQFHSFTAWRHLKELVTKSRVVGKLRLLAKSGRFRLLRHDIFPRK